MASAQAPSKGGKQQLSSYVTISLARKGSLASHVSTCGGSHVDLSLSFNLLGEGAYLNLPNSRPVRGREIRMVWLTIIYMQLTFYRLSCATGFYNPANIKAATNERIALLKILKSYYLRS